MDLRGHDAAYVFAVTVRLAPETPGVWADPETMETTVFRSADPPGEEGWLFFRDNCWRGELGAPEHFRPVVEDAIEAPVAAVEFRELRTTEAYLDDLKAEIGANLDLFNAESTTEVLSKYLGSSIHVVG